MSNKRAKQNLKMWMVMVVVFLVSGWFCESAYGGEYGGGTGEPNEPYLIYTPEQMNAIGADPCDWDKDFKLMADIDLSAYTGTSFNIIGISYDNPFTGLFDGNGHTISNFSYNSTGTNYIGVFGKVGGEIKDLGLIGPDVDAGTRDYVGSLVGRLTDGTITGCYVEGGSVSGGSFVGGLVGYNLGTITNCYSAGSVSGTSLVGGLVGINYYGTVSNCQASGSVSGEYYVGGLVGLNLGDVSDCYATGSVTGTAYVGGLAGKNGEGPLPECPNGDKMYCDGIYGWISNCYSTGSVTGTAYVGGLVGYNEAGDVMDSFWDTETSGVSNMCGDEWEYGSGCDDGNGKTTAEMQNPNTFTDAGWDFTTPVWKMYDEPDYPRLAWENCIPVADVGDNQTVFAWANGMATVKLDGSDSYDADDDELDYFWFIGDEQIATGVDPNVELAVGEHIIELVVNDGMEDSEPNEVVVTVIGPVEADMHVVPRVINRRSRMKRVMAIIRLPEGIQKDDIAGEPFVLEPGGVEAIWDRVIGRGNQATVFVLFDKGEVMAVLPNTGNVELTVTGKLESSQCIYGSDTVRIVRPRRRLLH